MISIEKEQELVHAVLAGDTSQYAFIVKEYQGIVANLTYKLVGDRLDVEEVVQRVFVELYSALPRFGFKARLSTFIYRITINVISKMLSHSKRFVSLSEADFSNETVGSKESSIVKEEQKQALRKAIGQLKYEQRTALVLYTYDDFSYQDIADVMQISLAKVESLIFRAKKNLKKMLDK